jgi:hypothetical protein
MNKFTKNNRLKKKHTKNNRLNKKHTKNNRLNKKHTHNRFKNKLNMKRRKYSGGVNEGTIRGNEVNEGTIRGYFNNLIKSTKEKCKNSNFSNCSSPSAGASQQVFICNDCTKINDSTKCEKKVFKSRPENAGVVIHIRENTISLDAYTLNLFIQTIIKDMITMSTEEYKEKDIEHYKNLCLSRDNLFLESIGADYGIHGNPYVTLEDYLLGFKEITGNDDSKLEEYFTNIIKCLNSIFEILDKLYGDIQFHHCDPKAAQIFLFQEGTGNDQGGIPPFKSMLADLDKVTFTVNFKTGGAEKPYRVKLTNSSESGSSFIKRSAIGLIKQNNSLTHLANTMRYEDKPRESNIYEKMCFLSSVLNLLPKYHVKNFIETYLEGLNIKGFGFELKNEETKNEETKNRIKCYKNGDTGKYQVINYQNIGINDYNSEKEKAKAKSLGAPLSFIDYRKYNPSMVGELHSVMTIRQSWVVTLSRLP